MHKTIFISGPFSSACVFIRNMAKRIFQIHGYEVLEKHGGVEMSAAELIDSADYILYIYGTKPAEIQDVWGRSLVIRELEYAAHRRKQASAIIIGEDGASFQPEMSRLRTHLKRQLGDKICCMPELPDNATNGPFVEMSTLILETIWSHRTNRPLPQWLNEKLPESIVENLYDKSTARTTLAGICSRFGDHALPDYSLVQMLLQRLEKMIQQWNGHIGPVVSDQVFISYSRRDVESAIRLQGILEESGYTVWRDEHRIRGGEFITDTLLQGIANSGAVMVLSSPASAKSNWVRKEVNFALQIQRDAGWRNYVLPISLDGAPDGILPGFNDINHIPLRNDSGHFANDVARILEHLDEPRLWHTDLDR